VIVVEVRLDELGWIQGGTCFDLHHKSLIFARDHFLAALIAGEMHHG
jgi:hypothetical protein